MNRNFTKIETKLGMLCVSSVRVTPAKCVCLGVQMLCKIMNRMRTFIQFLSKRSLTIDVASASFTFHRRKEILLNSKKTCQVGPSPPLFAMEGVIVFSPRWSLYITGVNSTPKAVFPEKHCLPFIVQNNWSVCPSASHFTFDHDFLSVIAFTYTSDVSQRPNLLRLGF